MSSGTGFIIGWRGRGLVARIVAAAGLLLIAGCHGGTQDATYPGTLGHDPPPAVNLPPQDAGMGLLAPQP